LAGLEEDFGTLRELHSEYGFAAIASPAPCPVETTPIQVHPDAQTVDLSKVNQR
jgi:hypothetical protein